MNRLMTKSIESIQPPPAIMNSKWLAVILSTGLVGCTWHGVPYSFSAYQAGKLEANQYLRDKGISAMNIGEPFGENEAEKALKTKYGIPTVLIATGMPNAEDIGRLKGFSEVMGKAARAKYGKDVLAEEFQR